MDKKDATEIKTKKVYLANDGQEFKTKFHAMKHNEKLERVIHLQKGLNEILLECTGFHIVCVDFWKDWKLFLSYLKEIEALDRTMKKPVKWMV